MNRLIADFCFVPCADQWCSTVQARDYVNLISTLYPKVLAGRQNDYWITEDDPKPRKKTVKKTERNMDDLGEMEPVVPPKAKELEPVPNDSPLPPSDKPTAPSPTHGVQQRSPPSLPSSRESDDGRRHAEAPKSRPSPKRHASGKHCSEDSPEKRRHHLECVFCVDKTMVSRGLIVRDGGVANCCSCWGAPQCPRHESAHQPRQLLRSMPGSGEIEGGGLTEAASTRGVVCNHA